MVPLKSLCRREVCALLQFGELTSEAQRNMAVCDMLRNIFEPPFMNTLSLAWLNQGNTFMCTRVTSPLLAPLYNVVHGAPFQQGNTSCRGCVLELW